MPLTLVIPGFRRSFEAAGQPRLPALELMWARATRRESLSTSACLAPLFGLAPDFPLAPFMRLGDGGRADAAYWLRADPVHLAPDRDQLVLMPGSLLQATSDEIQALAAAFNSVYGAEGWHLEFPHVSRGYLRAPGPLDAFTHDPAPIVGGPVFDAMPSGADGARLRQLMNETQMLFHTHAVNSSREAEGWPMINSLWIWGGGCLPATTGKAPGRIVTRLPLIRGLGLWAGRVVVAPPAEPVNGDLIALESDDLAALDGEWFTPLFAAVKSGVIGSLDLHLEGFGDFTLGPAAARRFWRRGRRLDIRP